VRFWDSVTGKSKASTGKEISYQSVWTAPCVSSDGSFFATADGLGVSVWNVATGLKVGPTAGLDWLKALALSYDGKVLATLKGINRVQIWEAENGLPGHELEQYDKLILPSLSFKSNRQIEMLVVSAGMRGFARTEVLTCDAQTGKIFKADQLQLAGTFYN